MSVFESELRLGAGLIGIGRKWGHIETQIPSERQAQHFLDYAYQNGIRYFDTAPSYGTSEQRLGIFLSSLSEEEKEDLIVATKFGEHWNEENESAYADHSFKALKRSIDQSIDRLGKIDILQVHKTSPLVLSSDDLYAAIDYARKQGVQRFGASVSDVDSAQMVCESDVFSVIQLPYNLSNTTFSDVISEALNRDKLVVVNRPFNMGATLYTVQGNLDEKSLRIEAYRLIANSIPVGVVLTGTKSPSHLQENIEAFNQSKSRL